MFSFRQVWMPQSKYGIKCPYAMDPQDITIHNTAGNGSAAAEISYMINNNNQVSYHVAVDDKEVIQAIPFNRNAWHAGDGQGPGNMETIGIEICYSLNGGSRFVEAEKNAAAYTAQLLKERGWGLDRVKFHYDWSGKYCPHRTFATDSNGVVHLPTKENPVPMPGKQRFLNMVQAELNKLNGKTTTVSQPKTDGMYRVRKSWKDSKSQIGAYKDLNNAKKALKDGYSVFDSNGNKILTFARRAVWDVRPDAELKAAMTVSTGGLYVNDVDVKNNTFRIDSLGGWVPGAHITKEGGKDGDIVKKGDHVTLDPVTVSSVEAPSEKFPKGRAKIHGYWVKCDMLWIKK